MILVAGLSPAWQQIMEFERLSFGEVNRARSVHWCASGKVLNVALALQRLGAGSGNTSAEPYCLTAVGGWSGAAIRSELAAVGVAAEWIEAEAPTRVCTTLLDRGSATTTELVENAAPLPSEAVEKFLQRFADLAPQASLIVLTGSLPAQIAPTLYADLLRQTATPALLDCRGPELLACLPLRPLVVKPNREELAVTVGRPLHSSEELHTAARELNQAGAQWVVVTDGAQPVLVSGADGTCWWEPTRSVTQVINPIGCGDCLAAGLAFGLAHGLDFPSALRIGLQAAAENAEQLLPAQPQPARLP